MTIPMPFEASILIAQKGTIAIGVGRDGSMIRFGDLNGDGRADYLAINSADTGATSAWLNGCSQEESPAPPGTIKNPDDFCAPLADEGVNLKTVENWQNWDIDRALRDLYVRPPFNDAHR